MNNPKYVVANENVLGYIVSEDEICYKIACLRTKIKGEEERNRVGGTAYFSKYATRIATKEDFDNFGVDSKGHLN